MLVETLEGGRSLGAAETGNDVVGAGSNETKVTGSIAVRTTAARDRSPPNRH
jgi:hypothetical protein